MRQTLTALSDHSLAFPSINSALADPNGLLAVGGDLSPQRILEAYRQGIFPWFSEDDPILWWSPDPRAIIDTQEIRINRTLRKFLKKSPYRISLNQAFEEVIEYCADAPFRTEETWILPEMQDAYMQLHKLGHAHSVEVWLNEELVGGLYGIAIGGFFSGESMFYTKPNASKVALVKLAEILRAHKISFIDCQLSNRFLIDMGCKEVTRGSFVQLKKEMLNKVLPDGFWLPRFL